MRVRSYISVNCVHLEAVLSGLTCGSSFALTETRGKKSVHSSVSYSLSELCLKNTM
jgi:hypothetical protein